VGLNDGYPMTVTARLAARPMTAGRRGGTEEK
jgi:hypothetical protein